MVVAIPIVKGFQSGGLGVQGLDQAAFNLVGYSVNENRFVDYRKPIMLGVTLLALSTIGSKLANRSGANRIMKKLTAGMVKLA